MKKLKLFILINFLGFFSLLNVHSAEKLKVSVSISPQKFFAEKIAGDKVDISVVLPPGRSPATYSPTPRQLQKIINSDILFAIGVPFEKTLIKKIKSLNSELKIIHTQKGIKLRKMENHRHSHEAEGTDPHVWLDPLNAGVISNNICSTLCSEDSGNANFYRENSAKFAKELQELNKEISDKLAALKNREFFVFHPAYGYFADRYKLIQKAIEIEGKTPTAKQLIRKIRKIRKSGIRVIIVQPQFSKKTAETIASSINGKILILNPLAENYIRNLKRMADEIYKVCSEDIKK